MWAELRSQRAATSRYNWTPHPAEALLPLLIEHYAHGLNPSGRKTIGQVLDFVFESLGCSLPSDDAYAGYFTTLNDIPDDLMRLAGRRVLENYKYPSAPKPADFRNAIIDEWIHRQTMHVLAVMYESHRALRDQKKEHNDLVASMTVADYLAFKEQFGLGYLHNVPNETLARWLARRPAGGEAAAPPA